MIVKNRPYIIHLIGVMSFYEICLNISGLGLFKFKISLVYKNNEFSAFL